jgi:hypothetical protein
MNFSVPDLDTYLKAFFYSKNIGEDFYEGTKFSDRLIKLVNKINDETLLRFNDFVERHGFFFAIALIDTLMGVREFKNIKEPLLIYPAQYLKIFPRLLYLSNFLSNPISMEHLYFVRYYPHVLVKIYDENVDTGEIEPKLGYHWVLGTHVTSDHENMISYNVAGEVGVGTIIEEELHAHRVHVHGKPIRGEILLRVIESSPDLVYEIERTLSLVMESEEKRFQVLGIELRKDRPNELRGLEKFVKSFEKEVYDAFKKK